MTDETPAERQEAAATRRRWVTLAEVLAVAGVVIAALGLYNSWSERRASEVEKVAAQTDEAHARRRVDLTATVADSGQTLELKDATHDITDLRIVFPRKLGVPAQTPVEPTVDAGWFDDAILKATDGGADDRTGRLPVLVTARYLDGDAQRSATAIYDIVWRTEGRLLRGRTLKMEGFRIRERGGSQARIDGMWTL